MFRFRIAERGSADFSAWLRLRTDLYLDTGLVTSDDLDEASGVYTDSYDDHSTHLLASDDDGVDIGTCRMIETYGDQTLPVTDLFGVERRPHSYEGSGVAVLPRLRKSMVSLGMYRAMAELADQRGYEYSYSIVEEPVLAYLHRLGYPLQVLSESRFVFNAANVATVIDRRELLPSFEKSDHELSAIVLRYYRKPFEWSLTESDLTP
jgi:N-acyl-L-homoserine lactone synthetase